MTRQTVTLKDTDRIIEMAWEDRTTFEAIEIQFGLKEKEVIALMRKEMKAIYEDSVLEESLGNVESAKEKWKKIMSEDLDFDDYSIKAKSKLQKYGAGG